MLTDIYFIVLDGYGRSDVLKEFYEYDNSDFLRGLKEKGFYQCCPGKVAPSDGKSRPFNVLWPVLPGNDLKSRGRKWSPERSIRTRHNEG